MFRLKLACPLDEEKILSIRKGILDSCQSLGFDAKLKAILLSLADELSCNVMEHSDATWLEITLSLNEDGARRLLFTIRDDGLAFDPIEAAGYFDEPVLVDGLDKHLGLWMMRPLLPELKYSRIDDKINQLEFTRLLT